MAEYLLIKEIIRLSLAEMWDLARFEWEINHIYREVGRTCLCGHNPITEICVLKNKTNGNLVEVGNCCVQKFMAIASNKLFEAIKRVKADDNRSLNADVIELAHKSSIITDWDRDFYLNTWRRRSLTEKQIVHRKRINKKILTKIKGFTT